MREPNLHLIAGQLETLANAFRKALRSGSKGMNGEEVLSAMGSIEYAEKKSEELYKQSDFYEVKPKPKEGEKGDL